jgi:D-aspartate ligase
LVKPLSVEDNPLPGKRKNYVARSAAQLRELALCCPEIVRHVAIQEIVPGGDAKIHYSTMYFNRLGIPLASFTARKLRQFPPDFGITSSAISTQDTRPHDIALGFLQGIGYRGLVDIEFIHDTRNNTFKFIELNMRSHWANSHALACSVNMFSVAYQDMIGTLPSDFLPPLQRQGIIWINAQPDFVSFCRKLKKHEVTVAGWFKDVIRTRSFAILDFRDMLPLVVSLALLAWRILRRPFRTKAAILETSPSGSPSRASRS